MTYNDKAVRQFVVMTVIWGIVGMLVGVIIAAQLWLPQLNFDVPWLCLLYTSDAADDLLQV